MNGERSVVFHAESAALEGRLAIPAGARVALVMCHPHPQYGGDMDNQVVTGLVAHAQRAGIATLRFNFRGTGASTGRYAHGVGEADDARAAVALLREECHLGQVALAGYSFGALVALLAGHDHPHVDRLIAIAPPLTMFDMTFLRSCLKPKLFLLGDRDQYCPYTALEQLNGTLAGTNVLRRLTGEDHSLAGAGERIGRAVVECLMSA